MKYVIFFKTKEPAEENAKRARVETRTIFIIVAIIFILIEVGAILFQSGNNEEEQEPSYKILFIGNSMTYWNDGLDQHIEKLASSADPPLIIKVNKITLEGVPLERIWLENNSRTAIESGYYDVVVLQEFLSRTFVETFQEYARKFDTVIKEAGAETVLLMVYSVKDTWAIARASMVGDCLGYVPIDGIANAHRDIAEELGCKVAPWGLAFHRVEFERPDLNLYDTDKLHPSIYGTYLAVNVVYATIFDENPEGLTYCPKGINRDDGEFLRRMAWEIVQEYGTQ